MRLAALALLAMMLAGCSGSAADVVLHATQARMLPRNDYDYYGQRFTYATGALNASVDTRHDRGSIEASVVVGPDQYSVRWSSFGASAAYQSGGAARGIRLHGTTGNGSSELPEFFAYLACYGSASIVHNGEQERDPTTGRPEFGSRLLVARGHVRDAATGIVYNDARKPAYDPAKPREAWVNATGSQAILQLRTATDQIAFHFEFEDVRLEKY